MHGSDECEHDDYVNENDSGATSPDSRWARPVLVRGVGSAGGLLILSANKSLAWPCRIGDAMKRRQ